MRMQSHVAIVSSLLTTSVSCFSVLPPPLTVSTTSAPASHHRTSTRTACFKTSNSNNLFPLSRSLHTLDVVHRVGRGGGGLGFGSVQGGKWHLSAAVLPFAQFLPPQVCLTKVHIRGFIILSQRMIQIIHKYDDERTCFMCLFA